MHYDMLPAIHGMVKLPVIVGLYSAYCALANRQLHYILVVNHTTDNIASVP